IATCKFLGDSGNVLCCGGLTVPVTGALSPCGDGEMSGGSIFAEGELAVIFPIFRDSPADSIAKFGIVSPGTFPNLLLHAQPEPPAAVLLPKLVDRAKVCRRKTVNIGCTQPTFIFPDSDLQQYFPRP